MFNFDHSLNFESNKTQFIINIEKIARIDEYVLYEFKKKLIDINEKMIVEILIIKFDEIKF